MKKNLFMILFVFGFPSLLFADSGFDSRHSLMPKASFDEKVETKQDEVKVVEKVAENKAVENSDIYDEPVIVSSDGIMVDDGKESFFLKRPVPSNNVSVDESNDFRASGPKLDKPEGYDELMQMVREQGVIKPSSYSEDKNGNLVLSSTSPQNVSSNIVNEKKSKMINKPLFENKGKKKKKKTKSPYQSVAHVATYNDRESAKKGIDVFVSDYPFAERFEPFISNEYVEGRGEMYKLYFLGNEGELFYLCSQMRANGDWCNILK